MPCMLSTPAGLRSADALAAEGRSALAVHCVQCVEAPGRIGADAAHRAPMHHHAERGRRTSLTRFNRRMSGFGASLCSKSLHPRLEMHSVAAAHTPCRAFF
jgi:hypothetical protein